MMVTVSIWPAYISTKVHIVEVDVSETIQRLSLSSADQTPTGRSLVVLIAGA